MTSKKTGADLAEEMIKKDRFSMSRIAKECGIPISKVRALAECMGISTARRTAERYHDEIKQMFDAGITDADIAKEFNLSLKNVALYRRSLGISRPHSYRPHIQHIANYPRSLSATKVAYLVGCNPKTVLKQRRLSGAAA